MGCIARIRSSLAQAVHHFFQNLNFININTPIITDLNCENANDMFQITNLSEENKIKWIRLNNQIDSVNFEDSNTKLFFSDFSKKAEGIENQKINKKEETEPVILKRNKTSEMLEIKSNQNFFEAYCNREINHIFHNNQSLNEYENSEVSQEIILNSDIVCAENFSNLFLLNDNENSKDIEVIMPGAENSMFVNKSENLTYKKAEFDISCELYNTNKDMLLRDLIENKNSLGHNNEEDDYIMVNSENKLQVQKLVYEKIFSQVNFFDKYNILGIIAKAIFFNQLW